MTREDLHTWHEDDDFWELMAPFMFQEQRMVGAVAEVDQVLALLGVEPEASILDLGCGPGRHTLELARRGFTVTGVDRTAAFLQKARRKANRDNLSVEFVLEDMRRFRRAGAFDGALSLFTSFGYFEDPAENLKVLANIQRSLKEGGSLIIEVMGKEVLARIFQEKGWDEVDGAYFLLERRVSKNWNWMENRWILLQDQIQREFCVTHWLYSAAELSALLKESGFKEIEIFGTLDGDPYDQRAKRLVAVAHK
jgi:SAM-dependent methyltransferase